MRVTTGTQLVMVTVAVTMVIVDLEVVWHAAEEVVADPKAWDESLYVQGQSPLYSHQGYVLQH